MKVEIDTQLEAVLEGLRRFGLSAIGHGQSDLLSHLKGTAAILARWNCSDDLVKAGLCHSIYGTESFSMRPASLDDRDDLRNIIGNKAERLAYLFGAHQKQSLWKNLDRSSVYSVVDRFGSREESISTEELSDLVTLTLANWLEQRPRASAQDQFLRKVEFLKSKDLLSTQAYEDFLKEYSLEPETKEKVMAYITRSNSGKPELLVFEHRDFSNAGIQVPAGTVDSRENCEQAILREIWEESGLEIHGKPQLLGTFYYYREDRNELHRRSVFHFEAVEPLPDRWTHRVGGQGEDEAMVFEFFWLSLEEISEVQDKLAAEQGVYLREVLRRKNRK